MPPVDSPPPLGGTAELCPGEIRLVYDRLRSAGFPPSTPAPRSAAGVGFTDRYRMVQRTARGGMGEIWKAYDVWFDRRVAVKVLRPELADDPKARSRFLREARLHARLHHPAVVPVYDLGETPDGRLYLTMEFIDGWSLERLLENPSNQAGELLRAFRKVCQAVAHAHTHRVLHRDIKPHNVMITRGGKLRLIDWGLACELGVGRDDRDPNETLSGAAGLSVVTSADTGDWLTTHGAAVGTPGYMSPEQARGDYQLIDRRTDVFGLGALLCEILTGHPPFTAPTLTGVWALTRDGDLAPARDRLMRCGADVRLIKLCLKCLAHSPLDRPPDVEAVLVRLPG
jgi:serine/threonine-protein kinase